MLYGKFREVGLHPFLWVPIRWRETWQLCVLPGEMVCMQAFKGKGEGLRLYNGAGEGMIV